MNEIRDKFTTYDNLFGDPADITELEIGELHSFKNHPFRVIDDDSMEELKNSIKENGILVPVIVREDSAGGYEIIAGHRRTHAASVIGLERIPALIREYTYDEAVIAMTDSNIQREDIRISEKARAYAMKYEAMKHQGKSGGRTVDEMGEMSGESGKTIQRYLWLSRLSDEFLELLDDRRLGFTQGVNLSFLDETSQNAVLDFLKENEGYRMTVKESLRIKEYFLKYGSEEFREQSIPQLLGLSEGSENYTGNNRRISIGKKVLDRYFGPEYDDAAIEGVIMSLLDAWKEKN